MSEEPQASLFDQDTEPEPIPQPWTDDRPLDGVGLDEYLSLIELLNTHAAVWTTKLGHADPPVGERGRPYWRTSMLGYCMRRQVLWRAGIPDTRVESAEDQVSKERRFQWGNDLHSHVADRAELAGLLIATEVPLYDEALKLNGNVDLLWGGRVRRDLPVRSAKWSPEYADAVRELRRRLVLAVGDAAVPVTMSEIKTTSDYGLKYWFRDGPPLHARMQLAGYVTLARRHPEQLPIPEVPERFTILALSRDAVQPAEFGLPPGDPDLVVERLDALNAAWASGEWPNCTCGLTKTIEWEQRFCPYGSPTEANTCCGQDLLARLEASLEAR